jgi:glutaredoxin 3
MIEIYYRPTCPFCIRAVKLLNSKNLAFTGYNINSNPDIYAEMKKRNPYYLTVPQIYIDGKFIGGCNELYDLDEDGKL